MKLLFKSLIILLLLPAVVTANDKFKGKYTKTKTLNKEYAVNANAGLRVDNSYGNIDITTWSENRTVIEVTITTNGDNEEKVQKRLEEIDVEFSGSATLVSAKTRFGGKKGGWSMWGNKRNNVQVEVNYTIRLPVTNSVDLSNDYGSISLNQLDGNAKISCDYGQIIIGELRAEDNSLNFDYTNNSTIEYMKSGRINADYSGFTLDKVERLDLNADYSNSDIGEADELNYNSDYGKLVVGKVNKLVGSGNYIPNKIGTVTGSLNLNTDYGSIHVDRLTSSVKDVVIKSDYTGVKLGYDSSANFDFIVKLSYAGFNGTDDLNVQRSDKSNSNKLYEGYHGSANSGNTININSTYGGVSMKKL
ncbi:hypothetical protein [Aureitalea sp. L0-47]|uniref:hypothetical protein n=1 Tax=Aureitalea sp. L0-47 TaxID=2816962 RepID=UPI002238C9DE|nr:hypothetical protein [Aureitalea sp. L0-47]